MNLAQIDLNLLYILKHLLEEKHVSNTAFILKTSQSTVSRALKKMRQFFDDELLVRTNYGYELTPKAAAVKLEITSLIDSLERLTYKPYFEPSEVTSTVRFFGLQPQMNALMPSIVAKIRQLAPNMVVSMDTTPKRHFEALVAGDVHFVLSSHQPPSAEQYIHRLVIAKRDFRLLMSATHPLAKQELTPELLATYPFGQISLQGERTLSFAHKLKEVGLINHKTKLVAPVQLSSFDLAPAIAEQSDIIFHLPTSYANTAGKSHAVITKVVPESLQLEFGHVYLYWHKRFHDDPMCVWVRELFKQRYVGKDVIA